MLTTNPPRRLIVNADDFGLSAEINQAVIQAHRDGILTSASLMVNEPGLDEAVQLVRDHPHLGVGLHLTLLCGHAALREGAGQSLADGAGIFRRGPVQAGWDYFHDRSLREPLRAEIAAQFEKFFETGLPLDHVNGHLHLHLHPTIFRILLEKADPWGIRRFRVTRDPLWLNVRLAPGRWFYRLTRWFVYLWLGNRATAPLAQRGIRYTARVFGLLQDSQVDRDFLEKLLRSLPAGDSELYSHPSVTEFKHELAALVDPQIKRLVHEEAISLIRYQDL